MKYVRRSVVILALLIVAATLTTACAEDQTSDALLTESTWEVELIVLEDQLLPPDPSLYDDGFAEVYELFLESIRNRDLAALENLWEPIDYFDMGIKDVFGYYWNTYRTGYLQKFIWDTLGEPDIDDDFRDLFYKVRDLVWFPSDLDELEDFSGEGIAISAEAIASSYLKHLEYELEGLMWEELEYIVAPRGATYDDFSDSYIVPYTICFCGNEDELCAIIDENVAVYKEPDTASDVIDYLSYHILEDNYLGGHQGFGKVRTLSGAEGYIEVKFIRRPYGVCCEFERNADGGWKLVDIGNRD